MCTYLPCFVFRMRLFILHRLLCSRCQYWFLFLSSFPNLFRELYTLIDLNSTRPYKNDATSSEPRRYNFVGPRRAAAAGAGPGILLVLAGGREKTFADADGHDHDSNPAAVVQQAPTSPPSASTAASTAKKATSKSGIPKVFLQISPSSEGFHYKYHVKRRLGKDWKYVHWNDRKCLEFIVKTPLPGLFEEARREASAMEFPAMVEKYGVAGENDYKASRVYQLVQFFLREKFIQGAHGADFCRMYFLYVHGGVYMDTDMMLYTDVWESAAAASSGNDPENANPGVQQVQEGGIEAILGDSETGLVVLDAYRENNRLTDYVFREQTDQEGQADAGALERSCDEVEAEDPSRGETGVATSGSSGTSTGEAENDRVAPASPDQRGASLAPAAESEPQQAPPNTKNSGSTPVNVRRETEYSGIQKLFAKVYRNSFPSPPAAPGTPAVLDAPPEGEKLSALAARLFELKVEECSAPVSFTFFKPFLSPLFWRLFRRLLVQFVNANPFEEMLFCAPPPELVEEFDVQRIYGVAGEQGGVLAQAQVHPQTTSAPIISERQISDLYGRGNYVKLRMSFGLQDSADADLSDSAFFRQHLSCAAAEAANLNMTGIDHCSDVLPLLQAPSAAPTKSSQANCASSPRTRPRTLSTATVRPSQPRRRRGRFLSVVVRANATSAEPFTTSAFFASPDWRRQFPDVTNATLIDLGFIATVPRHPVILEALHDLYRTRRSVLEDPTRNYWVFCTRMWHSVTRFQKFVGVGRSNRRGQEELEPVQDEARAAVQRHRRVDESIPFLPQPWHNERILDFDSESDLKYTRRNNYVVEDIPIYLLNLRFRNLSEVDYIFRDFGVPDLAVADSKKTSGNVRKNAVVMNAEDMEDSPRPTPTFSQEHHNANFYHAGRRHPDKVPDHVPGDHASGFFSYVKHVEGLGSRTKVKILPMREVGTVSCGDTVLGPAMGRVLGRNCNTYFVDVDDSTGLPHDKSKGGERAVLKHFHRTKAIPDHELRKPLTNVFTYAWSNKSAFDRETALMHG